MRRLISSCVLALAFIVLQRSPLEAQSFPSGSYQQTCRNIDVQGGILVANCQDSDGRWEATQLRDYRTCGSDIMNDNGALRCGNSVATVQQPGYSAGVPAGSYTQTCQEVRVHGDDLEARCQNSSGDWHKTKLDDFQKCHGDVANENGNLRCVSGAYPPGYPGAYRAGYPGPGIAAGSPYTQTCKDIKSHGDDLQARCKTVNGDWRDTSLDDYRKCHGQIVNEDGNLRCVAGPVGGYLGGTPAGSYTQSCQEIHVNGDDLEARCSTTRGDVRSAKLDGYAKCRSDIINDDGHLRCSK